MTSKGEVKNMQKSKKQMQYIVIATVILFVVLGAWLVVDKMNVDDSGNSDIAHSAAAVAMTVHNVTPSNISFTLENPTRSELLYGDSFSLYAYRNNSWERVEPIEGAPDFTLAGFFLTPHSETNLTRHWQDRYGELPPGDYKFKKSIDLLYPRTNHILEYKFSIPE